MQKLESLAIVVFVLLFGVWVVGSAPIKSEAPKVPPQAWDYTCYQTAASLVN